MNKIKTYYKKINKTIKLSLQLAKSQFKLRNEGSYLGILWYLLNPILMFGFLFLIFSNRLGKSIPYYSIYLLLGIIIFDFFQRSTSESSKSILKENNWIIKAINFPKEALVIGINFKNLFSHFFEIFLICFVLIYLNIPIWVILFYFILFIFFFCFTLGCCLILSSLTVYVSDIENIWAFFTKLLWFGTPIFYAIEGQTKLFYLNLVNPLYYYITIARQVIIYQKIPNLSLVFGSFVFSAFFLFLGFYIFNKLKYKFAEMV